MRQYDAAVKLQQFRIFQYQSLEIPSIGRYKPGPAKYLAWLDFLDFQRGAHQGRHLNADFPALQQIEFVSTASLLKKNLTLLDLQRLIVGT